MQSDILFDNIYIGHSIEDAAALAAETYGVKRPVEDAEDEANKPKPSDPPKSPSDLSFKDDPVNFVKEKFDLFLTIAKTGSPIEAIKFVPEIGYTLVGVFAVAILSTVGVLFGSSSAAPSKEDIKKTANKAKAAAVDAKDKAVDAATSAADTVKAEANKRTTRSSAAVDSE